jgi:uncharacterized membrane protein YjjP (DUF1212 family)
MSENKLLKGLQKIRPVDRDLNFVLFGMGLGAPLGAGLLMGNWSYLLIFLFAMILIVASTLALCRNH